jgi:hypothetical protein
MRIAILRKIEFFIEKMDNVIFPAINNQLYLTTNHLISLPCLY